MYDSIVLYVYGRSEYPGHQCNKGIIGVASKDGSTVSIAGQVTSRYKFDDDIYKRMAILLALSSARLYKHVTIRTTLLLPVTQCSMSESAMCKMFSDTGGECVPLSEAQLEAMRKMLHDLCIERKSDVVDGDVVMETTAMTSDYWDVERLMIRAAHFQRSSTKYRYVMNLIDGDMYKHIEFYPTASGRPDDNNVSHASSDLIASTSQIPHLPADNELLSQDDTDTRCTTPINGDLISVFMVCTQCVDMVLVTFPPNAKPDILKDHDMPSLAMTRCTSCIANANQVQSSHRDTLDAKLFRTIEMSPQFIIRSYIYDAVVAIMGVKVHVVVGRVNKSMKYVPTSVVTNYHNKDCTITSVDVDNKKVLPYLRSGFM